MDRQKNITCITGLLDSLVRSAQADEPHPWLDLRLTREQLRIMFLLFFQRQSSPGEVAERLGVPKANVTSTIGRLVDKGLVSRQANPDDRRSHVLSLTEEGMGQVQRLRTMGATKIQGVLDRMTDSALVALRIGLESLREAFKDAGEQNGCHRSQ